MVVVMSSRLLLLLKLLLLLGRFHKGRHRCVVHWRSRRSNPDGFHLAASSSRRSCIATPSGAFVGGLTAS
jgi:hypothetical protein